MGIFKKSIKHSKSSKDLNDRIKSLDEDIKKTGFFIDENNKSDWRKSFYEEEKQVDLTEEFISEVKEKQSKITKVEESIKYAKSREIKSLFTELYGSEVQKVVEAYVSNVSRDIVHLREDLFCELDKTPKLDIKSIEEKLNYLTLKYNRLYESIQKEQSDDPLLQAPINLEQLKNHYQLLVGRLQEQLASLGGGGEVRLQYLDDIVGIATNASAYDGKFLRYNHSLGKFEFVTVSGGGGGGLSDIVDDTTPQLGGDLDLNGNTVNGTGTIDISGTVTADSFTGSGENLTNIPSSQLTGALPAIDGSALTGIIASGTGIVVQEEGSSLGTASTINFVGSAVTATFSGGIATVEITAGGGGGGGIALTSLSVTENPAEVASTLEYDNTTGVFTYTPLSLENYSTTGEITLASVTSNGATTTEEVTLGVTSTTNLTAQQLNVSGIITSFNKIEVRSNDSTSGRIDYYCEVGNAHYTRVQAAPHSEYSGNATVILPTVSGDILIGDTESAISQNLNTTGGIDAGQLNVTGVSTFVGDMSVTGASTFVGDMSVTGVVTVDQLSISQDSDSFGDNNRVILGNDLKIYSNSDFNRIVTNEKPLLIGVEVEDSGPVVRSTIGLIQVRPENDEYYGNNSHVIIGFGTEGEKLRTIGYGVSVTGGVNATGIVTASEFSGPNTLKERTIVSGSTTSIANNGIGNTDITGFKSYALMKVGLSTAGWLRIYTDSESRTNDASRSIGQDPSAGSGVIAEFIATGVSTTQKFAPFVMGGNMDEPVSDTIYMAITNTSGVTTSITANLTILKLEA